METNIEKLKNTEIKIKVQLNSQEFNRFFERALLSLGKDVKVDGFRKGMVPKRILEEKLNLSEVLREAADLAVKEIYSKIVAEKKLEPISLPKIDILKLAKNNPFVFQARFFVLPEIKLPDYKKIASFVKRREIYVTEKEIDNTLRWIQRSRAKFTVKNEPAQKGDFIEIEYESPQLGEKKEDRFILGEGHFLPGFEEELIGTKTGQEKEILVSFPKDHYLKNLAGKKIKVKVKIKSVQKIEFPEITDEFARSVGRFKDLEDLKKSIKEGIGLEKKETEKQRVRGEILERITEKTDFQIPEILIKQEQQRLLENLKRDVSEKLKISFEEYLKRIQKTEKEVMDLYLAQAKKRVKEFLVLREIGKKENVKISEEEIEQEANKFLKNYTLEQAQKKIDPEKLKEYTKEIIRTEKIFQILENCAEKS